MGAPQAIGQLGIAVLVIFQGVVIALKPITVFLYSIRPA